jgi:hypothetical protein
VRSDAHADEGITGSEGTLRTCFAVGPGRDCRRCRMLLPSRRWSDTGVVAAVSTRGGITGIDRGDSAEGLGLKWSNEVADGTAR